MRFILLILLFRSTSVEKNHLLSRFYNHNPGCTALLPLRIKYVMTSPLYISRDFWQSFTLAMKKSPMTSQLYCFALFIFASVKVFAQPSPGNSPDLKKRDAIVDKYLRNGAWKFHMYSDQWQQKIDDGLSEDSTIAYLWQQKAMPLYKQKRYREGLPFLDNAVRYDRNQYLPYRGFMKCIFAKDYQGAIEDFSHAIEELGNGYVMDHSYKFYSAVAYSS